MIASFLSEDKYNRKLRLNDKKKLNRGTKSSSFQSYCHLVVQFRKFITHLQVKAQKPVMHGIIYSSSEHRLIISQL